LDSRSDPLSIFPREISWPPRSPPPISPSRKNPRPIGPPGMISRLFSVTERRLYPARKRMGSLFAETDASLGTGFVSSTGKTLLPGFPPPPTWVNSLLPLAGEFLSADFVPGPFRRVPGVTVSEGKHDFRTPFSVCLSLEVLMSTPLTPFFGAATRIPLGAARACCSASYSGFFPLTLAELLAPPL